MGTVDGQVNRVNRVTKKLERRGRYFFEGDKKFLLQGITYGPFRNLGNDTHHLGNPTQARHDFELIRAAGFNILRVAHVPPGWFMDLAADYGLRVLVGFPWLEFTMFYESSAHRRELREKMVEATAMHRHHPALFGYYVGNEINPDVLRWYGPKKIENFLDETILAIKSADDSAFVSYSNYPLTEFLVPKQADFLSYNVYLHDAQKFRAYAERLLNKETDKPLIIGEFGMDTNSHSVTEQSALLTEHHRAVFELGLAGTFVFSFTDEWFHTGHGSEFTEWSFGIVDRERNPKPAYYSLAAENAKADQPLCERFPLGSTPLISVVVCSYNGGSTLRACLDSLTRIAYPHYEVVVVDDGSTDQTQEILRDFPQFRVITQPNRGLSVARNEGILASRGEIVAFTDSDCIADADWLYHLAKTFQTDDYAAVGGPNISPPLSDWLQMTVAAAPGAASHVLLSDKEAEHIPGCNMAFLRRVFDDVGFFDPQFKVAGDDVDICWRILQKNYRIGFSPSAIVLHYRRFTPRAYIRQQMGYGKAEGMLSEKYFQHFNRRGSIMWSGTVYGQPYTMAILAKPIIYYGAFGTGSYASLYQNSNYRHYYLYRSLGWWLMIACALIFSLAYKPLLLILAALLTVNLAVNAGVAWRHPLPLNPHEKKMRLVLFYLYTAQPVLRSVARLMARKVRRSYDHAA